MNRLALRTMALMVSIAMGLSACSQNVKEGAEEMSTKDTTYMEPEQLKKDIGEMLLVGFRGRSVNEESSIVRDIRDYYVGNIILFEYDAPSGTRHRNIESPAQLRALCTALQKYGKGRLLIGVDQEGGNVARLRAKDGFATTRTAQATAEEGKEAVRKNAEAVAEELAEAGINLNFAPCVDVNINPSCPVIGQLGRSFSEDPKVVAECARIWIETQGKRGIASCLKHFPGHGSAKGDTHSGWVDVTDTWKEIELKPYKKLMKDGEVDMVMVAHVVNRQLGDNLPASLSPAIVEGKLRKELGFNGVVVTDDLAMGAIAKQFGFEEAIRMAIAAGCDMLCLSNNGGKYDSEMVPKAVNAILNMVEKREVDATVIHTSAERIRQLKKKVGLAY